MKVNEKALKIIEELNKAGYEGFIVGGCVRDSLLGKEPKDWDICTEAKPEQMIEVFKDYKVIPTGLKHGTITVMIDDEGFEVTTYRYDGDYSDGRHPDEVVFTDCLELDVLRRDFTINAMVYSEKDGLIDMVGGKEDLDEGIVRCVGSPKERFNEDALRILRAMRFASVLDFKIGAETARFIHTFIDNLKNISVERINVEITKMLCGKGAERILNEFKDVIFSIITEIKVLDGFKQNNPYHNYDVWTHTLKVVSEVNQDKSLRLAALFHDIGKPASYTETEEGRGHFHGHPDKSVELAELIMKRLRYSNEEIEEVLTLVKYHDVQFTATTKFIKRMLSKMTKERFIKLLELKRADIIGQKGDRTDERLLILNEISELLNNINLEEGMLTVKQLAVNGNDLIAKGYVPGKELGAKLHELLEMVLNEEVENEREALLVYC